jgi:DNA mismatch repair protein MSH4
VGLAFVNLDTGEAVLCQISDSQTYVRTLHKLRVLGPSEILIVSTASSPKSKLFSIVEENLEVLESKLTLLDRRYWSETNGYQYIQDLAFAEDVEAIKVSVSGKFYAVCCIGAVSLSSLMRLTAYLTILGRQVHRTRIGQIVSISLPQDQV